MRSVAMLACLVFIAILFKMDPRKKSEVSFALWIPTFWMLIIASRMVSQWFSSSDLGAPTSESYADGSPMDRNIFLVLIICALIVVIRRKINFSYFVRNNTWLVVFLTYCALSLLWSDFPVVSFKRYVKEIGNLMMAIIVISERNPMEAIKTLLKRCAYVLIPLSIVLYKYYSELGRSYSRWTGDMSVIGVTNNKNSLGVVCAVAAIGLFASLLAMYRNKTLQANGGRTLAQVIGLVLTLWVLILSHSATSLACTMVAVCILTVVGSRTVRKNIKAYALAVVIVVAIVYASGSLVSITAGTLGRDDTLTGRTEIWGKIIEMTSNPLLGGGYSRFWLGDRMEKLWAEYTWHPTEAHNGYLEIYLDLGLVGDSLILLIIVSTFIKIAKMLRTDLEQGALRLAMLTAAVLYNVTESAFRPGLLMYFIFVLVVVNLPRRTPAPVRGNSVRSTKLQEPLIEAETVTAVREPVPAAPRNRFPIFHSEANKARAALVHCLATS